MPRSSSLYLFPDVNVWIALTWQGHVHHSTAAGWFAGLGDEAHLCFCRITQLSFLRLLTTPAVMHSDVKSQARAWEAYDSWTQDPRIVFLEEPGGLERTFRLHSRLNYPASKDWADAYLLAFAMCAGIHLVTFDRGLHRKAKDAVLLSI